MNLKNSGDSHHVTKVTLLKLRDKFTFQSQQLVTRVNKLTSFLARLSSKQLCHHHIWHCGSGTTGLTRVVPQQTYGYDVKVEGRLMSQLVLFLIRSVQDVKILRMELVYLHQAIALNKQ